MNSYFLSLLDKPRKKDKFWEPIDCEKVVGNKTYLLENRFIFTRGNMKIEVHSYGFHQRKGIMHSHFTLPHPRNQYTNEQIQTKLIDIVSSSFSFEKKSLALRFYIQLFM